MRHNSGGRRNTNSQTSPRIIRASSPTSRPILPPLHPLPLTQSGQGGPSPSGGPPGFQSFTSAGNATASSSQQPPPGSWAPNWPTGHLSRHSIDAPPHVMVKSASTSPDRGRNAGEERERGGESSTTSSGPDIVFTRDVTNRQPRSMMACMRCRRQK